MEKIRQYYDSEGFLRPYATKLRDSLLALRERTDGPVRVLFTTHSVPMTDANAAGSQRMSFEGNSAYVAQHLAAARWIMEQVGEPMNGVEWELVYQSRSGPPQVPWLEPDICDVIEKLPGKGVTGVAVVPLGFVSDHMEVLWDLDTEARDAVSYTHLTLPTTLHECRSRWSPYH